jgi:hypothetical protein
MFMSLLGASFTKAFEYARYCNGIKPDGADEGCYFLASALRGTCEDLIALKLIGQLSPGARDDVIAIEMARALEKAVDEQAKFFQAVRPFQPIIKFRPKPERVTQQRDRMDEIARTKRLDPEQGEAATSRADVK